MRYSIYIAVFCFYLGHGMFAQEQTRTNDKDATKPTIRERFVFGGNIFLQVGTYTMVNVSPAAGFYFTPKLFGGTSLTYQYYYEKWFTSSISSHIFGSSVFVQYALLDHIGKDLPIKSDLSVISHLEYEALNLDRDFSNASRTFQNRFWLHGILVGGGIKQHFGKRSSLNITVLYNLLWDKRTPYTNPLVRLGVYL